LSIGPQFHYDIHCQVPDIPDDQIRLIQVLVAGIGIVKPHTLHFRPFGSSYPMIRIFYHQALFHPAIGDPGGYLKNFRVGLGIP
jgi:hypothetical protein